MPQNPEFWARFQALTDRRIGAMRQTASNRSKGIDFLRQQGAANREVAQRMFAEHPYATQQREYRQQEQSLNNELARLLQLEREKGKQDRKKIRTLYDAQQDAKQREMKRAQHFQAQFLPM